MDRIPVQYYPLLFPLFFVAVWITVLRLISAMGWQRLAEVYGSEKACEGTRWYMQSAKVGKAAYNGCLIVGANYNGLYLSILFLFRPWHPPLFIPWTDISAKEAKRPLLLGDLSILTFNRAPGLELVLRKRLTEKIRAQYRNYWPGQDGRVVAGLTLGGAGMEAERATKSPPVEAGSILSRKTGS